jgi:hypothetical protein
MDLLNKFYRDFQVRDAVKEGMMIHLKKSICSKAFSGESTQGADMAKEVIDSFFRDLERTYNPKEKKTITSNR